jgi:hypothetical protein
MFSIVGEDRTPKATLACIRNEDLRVLFEGADQQWKELLTGLDSPFYLAFLALLH